MEYIENEVRAVCTQKGWKYQIRRKWEVREKPVGKSTIEDYEWKLIPDDSRNDYTPSPDGFDGVYYVISFDRRNNRFVLQHDTHHCGMWGPHHEEATYTEISLVMHASPPIAWLRDHLLDLTTRFGPNVFSIT